MNEFKGFLIHILRFTIGSAMRMKLKKAYDLTGPKK